MAEGRGRLSGIDLMPPEADGIIAWAAGELAARARTQTEIFAEFASKCEALMREHRGELDFAIPSFSAFNRYSMRQAKLTRRLDQTRELVSALKGTLNPQASDDLTILTAETIKSLVFTMLGDAEEAIEPKDAMHLASAFKSALQAQQVSGEVRRKAEVEFQAKVQKAVDTVARSKGLTAETAEAIKSQILGVS